MKHSILILALLLTACADSTTDDDTFGEESAGETSTDATGSDVGTGTESSSEEDETGDGDSSGVGDDSSTDSSGDGDGDGDSGGDGDSVGDGDGDGDSDDDSGLGALKLPGDACDPFVDWCVDGYGCDPLDNSLNIGEFRCREQFASTIDDVEQDMLYGSKCSTSQNCGDGLLCRPYNEFPDGDCDWNTSVRCCMDMCAYEETCANGNTCEVVWWQADLEDYLDMYTGIGSCSEAL